MFLKLKEKLLSVCKSSLYVFNRGVAFYAVAAIVLVGITFFSYVCGTSAKMNELSSKNAALSADKDALTDEVNDANDTIAEKDAENAKQNEEFEKIQAENDKLKAEIEDEKKSSQDAIQEILDAVEVDSNSRSGSDLYTSVEQIKKVEYAIRSTLGENEQTAEYLAQLEQLKLDAENKLKYYPDYTPLENGTLTSRFGYRNDPNGAGTKYHNGIDVWNNAGTPIYCTGAGTVIAAADMGAYGLCVKIDHGNGYESVYAHCSKLLVSAGDTVEKGQMIAKIGATGNATGNHLHYELMLNGERVNPLDYIFPQFS